MVSLFSSFGSGFFSLAVSLANDHFADIVGDSLTALTFLRNVFSTIFVFAMPAWVDAVGIPNVFNAICAIGLFVFSWAGVFIWKGKMFRHRTAGVYMYYASRQFEARPLN
jgi:hypothetical protein